MNRPIYKAESAAGDSQAAAAGSEHTTQTSGQRPHERKRNSATAGEGSTRSRTPTSKRRLADDRAPWRVQMQVTGTVLLVFVAVAIVALFYLNVSAKTAALGRLIQFYTVRLDGPHRVNAEDPEGTIIPIEEIDIRIAGLRAELAELTSLERMEARAQAMGFEPLGTESIIFLEVPGYQPRGAISLAPPPAAQVASASSILPIYRPSLIDELGQGWSGLVDKIMALVIQSEEVQP